MVTAFVFGSLVVALVGILVGGLMLLASDPMDWPPEISGEDE